MLSEVPKARKWRGLANDVRDMDSVRHIQQSHMKLSTIRGDHLKSILYWNEQPWVRLLPRERMRFISTNEVLRDFVDSLGPVGNIHSIDQWGHSDGSRYIQTHDRRRKFKPQGLVLARLLSLSTETYSGESESVPRRCPEEGRRMCRIVLEAAARPKTKKKSAGYHNSGIEYWNARGWERNAALRTRVPEITQIRGAAGRGLDDGGEQGANVDGRKRAVWSPRQRNAEEEGVGTGTCRRTMHAQLWRWEWRGAMRACAFGYGRNADREWRCRYGWLGMQRYSAGQLRSRVVCRAYAGERVMRVTRVERVSMWVDSGGRETSCCWQNGHQRTESQPETSVEVVGEEKIRPDVAVFRIVLGIPITKEDEGKNQILSKKPDLNVKNRKKKVAADMPPWGVEPLLPVIHRSVEHEKIALILEAS
ncbi:hypothetical protein C8R44DRAFT_742013 [Mycena epipterygia]|nr:hypothetical protein C8R44DRAFT_742013 [Mycena epipterygia]